MYQRNTNNWAHFRILNQKRETGDMHLFLPIKFSPNTLLIEKLQNECKNPSLFHRVTCIRSDHAGAVAKFHIHGFIF